MKKEIIGDDTTKDEGEEDKEDEEADVENEDEWEADEEAVEPEEKEKGEAAGAAKLRMPASWRAAATGEVSE